MRRSLALIAVAAAVAVAATVVVAGMSSRGDAGAGSVAEQSPGSLPSGHPTVAASDAETAEPVADPAGDDEALAALEAKRDEDPDDVEALLELGEAYFMRQHLQQAEQAYSQALAQDAESTAAQVGLALVWHAQGDTRRAKTALAALLEAHPDDQEAHYALAIVLFSAGRVEDAEQEWRTAARIDPTTTTGRQSQSFVDLLEDRESAAPSADDD